MLFVIVISFKSHKVKVQEIKIKTFFIKQKREYIIYIDRMSLHQKKKKPTTTTTITTKETTRKS